MTDVLGSIDKLADPAASYALVAGLSETSFRTARAFRLEGTQRLLDATNTDALVLSIGADLPWLSGYEAMPLERLTALVVTRGSIPTLLVPELEVARVRSDPDLFEVLPWKESSDPYDIVVELIRSASNVGVSDRMWTSAFLELQRRHPKAHYFSAARLLSQLRGVKDGVELVMLARAAHITDEVARELLDGKIPMVGRTEREVSSDISTLLIENGLKRVNFAIVGSGPNSASPHHEPGSRLIRSGDPVVCDFGGVYTILEEPGYCSDITRTVVVGAIPDGFAELYDVLQSAQQASRDSISGTITGHDLDLVAREEIARYGYGEYFIHRTGHGIGLEEHEEPYIVDINHKPLGAHTAFSIEPGIYLPGRFGARIEDICIAGEHDGLSLNLAPRGLAVI